VVVPCIESMSVHLLGPRATVTVPCLCAALYLCVHMWGRAVGWQDTAVRHALHALLEALLAHLTEARSAPLFTLTQTVQQRKRAREGDRALTHSVATGEDQGRSPFFPMHRYIHTERLCMCMSVCLHRDHPTLGEAHTHGHPHASSLCPILHGAEPGGGGTLGTDTSGAIRPTVLGIRAHCLDTLGRRRAP
jgi:hypothetical protein